MFTIFTFAGTRLRRPSRVHLENRKNLVSAKIVNPKSKQILF